VEAVPYDQLDDSHILALCIWREARGEMALGQRGVGCVVRNRIEAKSYFGHDYSSVILKPWQFSSFNAPPRTSITDPNSDLWPVDGTTDWMGCLAEANDVLGGCDDVTNGALFYFSPPLTQAPKAWGAVIPTASIGHLSFWKPAPPAVLDASDN
jgi:Cell Wall Hydrolase